MRKLLSAFLVMTCISSIGLSQIRPGRGGGFGQDGMGLRCLGMASNGDILNELNRRLNMSIPQPPAFPVEAKSVRASCASGYLTVAITDLQTAQTEFLRNLSVYSEVCQPSAEKLNKVFSTPLTQNTVVSVCADKILVSYLVSVDKQVKIAGQIDYGNNESCVNAAGR